MQNRSRVQLLAKVHVQHPLAHVLSGRWSRNETKFGLGLGLKNDLAEPRLPLCGVRPSLRRAGARTAPGIGGGSPGSG
jgi:hypothetical protein